jgi:branched-subunit amino acid aminotransferase/4-amino-4-deoxychorismate lyase
MSPPAPALIETIRVRHGLVPLLSLHERRLAASCEALGLPVPELDLPADVSDRVLRVEVGAGGVTVTSREVGPVAPVRLITSAVVHQPYRHKTTARGQFDLALAEAREAGAEDALMLTGDGFVAEAAIWCLYWWDGDRISAPALDLGVLPGVSRTRIEEIAGPVLPSRVLREALRGRSLFLSNAVRGVVPVAQLDAWQVPAHPGTVRLVQRFWP